MTDLVLTGRNMLVKGSLGFLLGAATAGNPLGIAAGVTLGEVLLDVCDDRLDDLDTEEALAKYFTTFGFSVITGGLGAAASTNLFYDEAVKLGGENLVQLFDGKVSFGNGETLAQLCETISVTGFDKAKEVMKLDKYVRDSYTEFFEAFPSTDKRLRRRRFSF